MSVSNETEIMLFGGSFAGKTIKVMAHPHEVAAGDGITVMGQIYAVTSRYHMVDDLENNMTHPVRTAQFVDIDYVGQLQ